MQKKEARPVFLQKYLHNIRSNPGLYIMIILPLVYLIIFKYVPIYGVQIAFRDYSPARSITASPWVGLKYVKKFISYYSFWEIMRNTLVLNLYSLAVFPIPIIFALMLNYMRSAAFKKTIQVVSYIPHFISTVVMVGIIMQFLDKQTGVINQVIRLFGGNPVEFMSKPGYFSHIYVWSGIWQGLGYNSIIYISALSGVSPELHEAAIMDGAGILKRIWHVDLPGILPTLAITFIMGCGSIFNVGYEKIYLMQNNLNLKVSEVISTYVYKQGIASTMPQYSMGAAIDLFVSLLNIVMLLLVNRVTKALTESSLW